ncbi:MAG: hypothetical protein KC615_15085 [Anaerolineae bacterium]|nr:hypothetical protein [Anaerolineae bacterium]
MIKKLLATLGILLSLMIMLAFTITLPEQGGEPMATLESWEKTASQIVHTVTQGAPGYETHAPATARILNLTATARYLDYIRDRQYRDLTSTAYAIELVSTFTSVVQQQTRVAQTATAIVTETPRTPIPVFETATAIARITPISMESSDCGYAESQSGVSINTSLQQQIRSAIDSYHWSNYTSPDVDFYSNYYELLPAYGYVCRENFAQMTIGIRIWQPNENIPVILDGIMAILDEYLTDGYQTVFSQVQLKIFWGSAEGTNKEFYHHRLLDVDYHHALQLYQFGLRGDDLIEALGGLYPYLEERYHG